MYFLAGEMAHWCQTPELDIVNCTKWSLDEEQCNEAKRSVAIPPSSSECATYEYETCVKCNLTGIEPSDYLLRHSSLNHVPITTPNTKPQQSFLHNRFAR